LAVAWWRDHDGQMAGVCNRRKGRNGCRFARTIARVIGKSLQQAEGPQRLPLCADHYSRQTKANQAFNQSLARQSRQRIAWRDSSDGTLRSRLMIGRYSRSTASLPGQSRHIESSEPKKFHGDKLQRRNIACYFPLYLESMNILTLNSRWVSIRVSETIKGWKAG
jgi:hypothetical protein